MQGLLLKYSIPGAALAVSRNGALLYARGFGYANVANATPVQPDSLFRIGSVSKTFTAIAVMELIQQGKIQLTQSAFSLLPNLTPLTGATLNPQLAGVTVQDLLNMTGGWDRSIVPDPVDNTLAISKATGLVNPLSCSEVIQYQLGLPLQHTPGSTYAYSNFGYCILGAIIQQVSGVDYVDFVRQNVLTPLGIQRAKQAEGLMSDTVNGEVTYYDYSGAPLATNLYNPTGPLVPAPYGNHDFLASEASGSWVATPIELLRFVNGIDGVNGGPLLQPATIQLMETETAAFSGAAFYGLGFDMHTTTSGGFNWFKDGGLPGTAAYLYKGANKVAFAVIFNSAPSGALEESSTNTFESDYVNQIETAIAAVTTWPTTDQFPTFASTLMQPAFRATEPVENAASGLSRIVPGSWVSLYGTNLATATRIWYNSEFNGNILPTNVDGVSVQINGLPASVYYVSPTQIDVQAPEASVNTSPATVVLTHDGQTSNTVKVNLEGVDPALFTYPAGGLTFAAAVAVATGVIVGDPAVEPGTAKVGPGAFVELYCNSLVASRSGSINPVNTLQTFPTVTIGGVNAPVSYAGIVSPGLFQINVQVPQTAPAGNQQVVVTYDGSTSPSGVLIPIGGN
ncbi:MAG: serine hydrolase [Bryobacteraceae bacterium]